MSIQWQVAKLAFLMAASAWIFAHAWAARGAECNGLEHLGDGRTLLFATGAPWWTEVPISVCFPTWDGYDYEIVSEGVVQDAGVMTGASLTGYARRGVAVDFCLIGGPESPYCYAFMPTMDFDADDSLIVGGEDFPAFRESFLSGEITGYDFLTFRALFNWDRAAEVDSMGHKVWR